MHNRLMVEGLVHRFIIIYLRIFCGVHFINKQYYTFCWNWIRIRFFLKEFIRNWAYDKHLKNKQKWKYKKSAFLKHFWNVQLRTQVTIINRGIFGLKNRFNDGKLTKNHQKLNYGAQINEIEPKSSFIIYFWANIILGVCTCSWWRW